MRGSGCMVSHIEYLLSFVHAIRFDELTTKTRTYMHSSTTVSRHRFGVWKDLVRSSVHQLIGRRLISEATRIALCLQLHFFSRRSHMRLVQIFWCSAHGLVWTQLATRSDRWTVILRAPNCTDRCSWNGPWSCHYMCSIASTFDGRQKLLELEA